MDYQKSVNLLDNTPIQPCKFWKKNWIEIIDKSRGTYGTDNQVKVSLCNYSNTYILADKTIAGISAEGTAANNVNKKVIFKSCAPFINCLRITSNTHVDDAHDIGAVMLMYNLIEYINNFFKKTRIFWQYCRDEPALDAYNAVTDFNATNTITDLFKFKDKITSKRDKIGTEM